MERVMDQLGPEGMALAVATSVVALVLLALQVYSTRRPKGSPPVVQMGMPLVGNPLEFVRGPLDMIRKCKAKYGPVYTVPMGHKRLTFLIGPEPQGPFYKSKDDVMSQDEVYGFMKYVFGKGVVYDASLRHRQEQMQVCATGLRSARLQAYVPKIEAETRDFIKKWGESGEFNILDVLSDLTILTASRCLHGNEVREKMMKQVADLYADLDHGITPLSFFFPGAPVPSHIKRDKARVKMADLFGGVIKSRREAEAKGADLSSKNIDLLQAFMDFKYKDGTKLTNDQITGLLIALLFAGQHTSSITSTWTTLLVAAHPDILRRLREEQKEVLKNKPAGAPLDWDDLGKMELLHNCIRETLRMFPPLIMIMRYARKSFEVKAGDKTYTVPKGDICFSSPAVAMREPEVFADPDRFDPDRYAPPREEHKQPYAYLGFGAGIHQCIGQQFGFTQVKTIMSILLREYDFALVGEVPNPDYAAMVVGPHKGECIMSYKKI